jgi:predicted SAM-dependent methyltransferase
MKLNLGSGDIPLDDYINLDGKAGDSLYPLQVSDTRGADIPEASCSDIRASHVLEHFSHRDASAVLNHWVSRLEPGGLIRIAVPDFQKIVEEYQKGNELDVQGYIFGGQLDERDYHRIGFDEELLVDMMINAGLERIHRWTSEIKDCAALPISLNMAGYKPSGDANVCMHTTAVLSAPRFGPVMHFRCAVNAFGKARVPYQIVGGAYWHQVLSEVMESQLEDPQLKYIITCDYDTVFCYGDVLELYRLMEAYPRADAILPLESRRGDDLPLFGVRDKQGKMSGTVNVYHMHQNLFPVAHGHFGLTILRADSLRNFKRPWMNGKPSKDGRWGDGKKDADIDFWHHWIETGRTLFLAPRVVVGHLQEMVAWPGKDLRSIYQTAADYDKQGMPGEARR